MSMKWREKAPLVIDGGRVQNLRCPRTLSTFRCSLWFVLVAACGFPRPPDVGYDAAPGESKYQLLALEPDIATTGDTITLEGTFDSTMVVNFPGNTSVPATVLGEHRAIVVVPESATAGALSVTTGGTTAGPLAFRRASFSLGLQPFQEFQHQANGARQEATLVTGRGGATSAVLANYIYLIGGTDSTGYLQSIERARINADGTLGPFTTSDVGLVTPRAGHMSVTIGVFLYVIGGAGTTGPLDSVERAMIGPDGSLGPFARVPDLTLVAARSTAVSVVLGRFLYVIGGTGNGILSSIERAIIEADGSLGSFATLPDITLATARTGHTGAIAGNMLYVMGGSSSSGVTSSVERSIIADDGALSAFAPVPEASLVTARANHTSVLLGTSLYILGGVGSSGELASIEQAKVHTDGSIDPFVFSSIGALAKARSGHNSTVLRNYFYLFGGTNSGGTYLNSVEHAEINAGDIFGLFSVSPDIKLIGSTRDVVDVIATDSSLYVFANGMVERAPVDQDSFSSFSLVSGATLDAGYRHYATAVIRDKVYVIGGVVGSATADVVGRTVIQATIRPDGTLSSFTPVVGVALVNPRTLAKSIIVGNRLYVIGGYTPAAIYEKSIEMATIGADGSLGPFAVSGATSGVDRGGCAGVIIGKSLYLIGGGSGAGSNVEGAVINDDNSLGLFAILPGINLTYRSQQTATVAGRYLYMIGGSGFGGISAQNSVERALIAADGSIGSFTPVISGLESRYETDNITIGNQTYLVGGTDNSITYTANVDQATLR